MAPWERRLEADIVTLRTEMGRVQQLVNGTTSKRLIRRLPKQLLRHLETASESNKKNISENYLDSLRQKLLAKAQRLRRYRESHQRKAQNEQSSRSQRNFYRNLRSNRGKESTGVPPQPKVEEFWSDIWENPTGHRENAEWIRRECERHKMHRMNPIQFTVNDIREGAKHLSNWKAPGRDGLHNYWLKKFTACHQILALKFNEVLNNPQLFPRFLTQGHTYLIPKSNATEDPSQYRPITCLPTMYKLLSALISNKVYTYLEDNNILTEEQKGCKRRAMGCKEQAIIDSEVLGQARQKNRNLYMGYIDYQKAFDSVPHSWLLRVMEMYGIDNTPIQFMKSIMSYWRTRLNLRVKETLLQTRDISIKKGIFQGDSFSALWFCLALNPLSNTLNRLAPTQDWQDLSHGQSLVLHG